MLIDTHCHLNMIAAQTEEVVERARKSGISTLITQGTGVATSKEAVRIAELYPDVYATVGIHPEDMADDPDQRVKDIGAIEQLLSSPKVVGIGEVGLDYFILNSNDKSHKSTIEVPASPAGRQNSKENQKMLFIGQIKLAIKHNKALVIHDREAVEDVLQTLQGLWSSELEYHTVFHCCPADERLLEFAVAHHIYIGVDGDISWSKKKQRFIASVPLELLVLETDAPFLVPLDLKKTEQENEPKNVAIVCALVAQARGVAPEEVAAATTRNASYLFSLHGLTK